MRGQHIVSWTDWINVVTMSSRANPAPGHHYQVSSGITPQSVTCHQEKQWEDSQPLLPREIIFYTCLALMKINIKACSSCACKKSKEIIRKYILLKKIQMSSCFNCSLLKGAWRNLQTRRKKLVSSQWNVNLLSNSYTWLTIRLGIHSGHLGHSKMNWLRINHWIR